MRKKNEIIGGLSFVTFSAIMFMLAQGARENGRSYLNMDAGQILILGSMPAAYGAFLGGMNAIRCCPCHDSQIRQNAVTEILKGVTITYVPYIAQYLTASLLTSTIPDETANNAPHGNNFYAAAAIATAVGLITTVITVYCVNTISRRYNQESPNADHLLHGVIHEVPAPANPQNRIPLVSMDSDQAFEAALSN